MRSFSLCVDNVPNDVRPRLVCDYGYLFVRVVFDIISIEHVSVFEYNVTLIRRDCGKPVRTPGVQTLVILISIVKRLISMAKSLDTLFYMIFSYQLTFDDLTRTEIGSFI